MCPEAHKKHTHNFFWGAMSELLEIPMYFRVAALFLRLNYKPIVPCMCVCVCPSCHRKQNLKHPVVTIGYLWHKHTTAPALFMQIMAECKKLKQSKSYIVLVCIQDAIVLKRNACSNYSTKQRSIYLPLSDLRSVPCPVPPGFHRGLWTAQSEPSHRCPTRPGPQSTEPPTRRARPNSGPNMVPMTRMEEEVEEEEEEGKWSTGTWPPDPQVRQWHKSHTGVGDWGLKV